MDVVIEANHRSFGGKKYRHEYLNWGQDTIDPRTTHFRKIHESGGNVRQRSQSTTPRRELDRRENRPSHRHMEQGNHNGNHREFRSCAEQPRRKYDNGSSGNMNRSEDRRSHDGPSQNRGKRNDDSRSLKRSKSAGNYQGDPIWVPDHHTNGRHSSKRRR
jgi:hypothetical protein